MMYAKGAAMFLGLNFQEVIQETINAGVEYLKVREAEKTKRELIQAKSQAFQAALQARREGMLAYFEHRFSERHEALAEFYGLLHIAVETGDGHQLDAAVCGILGIVKDNPLYDIDHFKETWGKPDALLEI